jgi:hypothetical protein
MIIWTDFFFFFFPVNFSTTIANKGLFVVTRNLGYNLIYNQKKKKKHNLRKIEEVSTAV